MRHRAKPTLPQLLAQDHPLLHNAMVWVSATSTEDVRGIHRSAALLALQLDSPVYFECEGKALCAMPSNLMAGIVEVNKTGLPAWNQAPHRDENE